MIDTAWLDSIEFYELMLAYRWADRTARDSPAETVNAFEAVKAHIRNKVDEACTEALCRRAR